MSSARVTSLPALRDLKVAIQRFIEEASAAVTEVDSEALRTGQWLRFDQVAHWASQARQRHDAVEAAKADLRRRQFTGLDDNPTAVEYRRNVDRAKRHEDAAREKVEHVRRWLPTIDRELTLYKGAVQPLNDSLARDLPAAMLRLDRMIDAIEVYASINMTPSEGMARASDAANTDTAAPRILTPEEAGAIHAPLRRRAARQAVRDSLPIAAPTLTAREADSLELPDIGLLAHLGLAPEPPAPYTKVILERGSLDAPIFFLQRLPLTSPDDSGWHIGFAGPLVSDDRELAAITIESLLSRRPSLAPLLDMPPGYLILCIGGGGGGGGGRVSIAGDAPAPAVIEVVLDPTDRQVFP